MTRFRRTVQKYERGFMIVLVVVLLVLFVVIDDIRSAARAGGGRDSPAEAIAGSFAVLAGERAVYTWARFQAAKARYALGTFDGSRRDVLDSDVWTHLVLLEAARREGIEISDAELVGHLKRVWGGILDDGEQYKRILKTSLQTTPAQYEDCVREVLRAFRVRETYRESFVTAPALSRAEAAKRHLEEGVETVRVTWAALDAKLALDDARTALAADAEGEKALREFFEKDDSVRHDPTRFRHPRRYAFEMLYTVHARLVEEADLRRVVELFRKTFPELDVERDLKPDPAQVEEYISFYRDRLLEQIGSPWGTLRAPSEKEAAEPTPEQPADPELEARRMEERANYAKELVRPQATREVTLRRAYEYLLRFATQDHGKPLRAWFDALRANDDPQNPVCSEETGKGLLVYREFKQPLSGDELQALEDAGMPFTHNFRNRIVGEEYEENKPRYGSRAETFGESAHGRMIFRVTRYLREAPKSFDELSAADRESLREDLFLPVRARERVKERLQALAKEIEDGVVPLSKFVETARQRNCRVFEDETIVTSREFQAPPSESLFWRDEYLRMLDRHVLRKQLAGLLPLDREQKRHPPGGFLDVFVDARGGSKDPGTAYLAQILERAPAAGEWMPKEDLDRVLLEEARARSNDEDAWWTGDFAALKSRFDMRFSEDMQRRIEEDAKRRTR
jgi:hypothetical protein